MASELKVEKWNGWDEPGVVTDGRFSWHFLSPDYVHETTADGAKHSYYLMWGKCIGTGPDGQPQLADPDTAAAAWAFDVARKALLQRVQALKEAAGPAIDEEDLDEPMTPEAERLAARYGTSDRAWEAEDEQAWAILQRHGL